MALLFVYGTLKEGFCNFRLNEGRRILGDFVTVEFFQLYVLGPLSLPWMVEANGQSFQVKGQLRPPVSPPYMRPNGTILPQ
jgi:gamma-glutamylaminecyclotransferase